MLLWLYPRSEWGRILYFNSRLWNEKQLQLWGTAEQLIYNMILFEKGAVCDLFAYKYEVYMSWVIIFIKSLVGFAVTFWRTNQKRDKLGEFLS